MRDLQWDIFCRVIDNHGDLGVAWRLSVQLADRGHRVRLWADQAAALAWTAPQGHAHVQVLPWERAAQGISQDAIDAQFVRALSCSDVVIEAFGRDIPAAAVQAMHGMDHPPVWINIEYLSAEAYVERSHGLCSPQFSADGHRLDKWFYYPGFTARTGGLLREPRVTARPSREAARARAHAPDLTPALQALLDWDPTVCAQERWISLFCYDQPQVALWFDGLSAGAQTTRVFLSPGWAHDLALAWLRTHDASATALTGETRVGVLILHPLPWLSQRDYDALLRACDFNCVRGEDSLVRALWAGRPWVWQAYVQSDQAHHDKVSALWRRVVAIAQAAHVSPQTLEGAWQLWARWNHLPLPAQGEDDRPLWGVDPWDRHNEEAYACLCNAWCQALSVQPDLCTQLEAFVATKRPLISNP